VESWDDRVAASWNPEYEGDGTDPWTEAPADATWLLTQLELVSLLLHETPKVYESDHLPRMDQLSLASTRALDSFETNSLAQLYNGEHFLVDARLNEIRMFGAIRAAKSCLACHDVRHKELLGAFTYTLTRAKPIELRDSPNGNE
jgi:hypothetical protein